MNIQVNTVNISLDEYLELKRIKKNIQKGKHTVTIIRGYWPSIETMTFFTESEIIKKCEETNHSVRSQLNNLHLEKSKLNAELFDLRRMSIWEFIKWRKQ